MKRTARIVVQSQNPPKVEARLTEIRQQQEAEERAWDIIGVLQTESRNKNHSADTRQAMRLAAGMVKSTLKI